LPVWQAIYEELRDQNFIFIAVALDSAGAAAAREPIEAAGPPPEMAPVLKNLMGWDDDVWSRIGRATYPCLIDEKHVVAELYDMVNVPTAVWIDERGRIVRPPESGGSTDSFRKMDPATFALPEDAATAARKARSVYLEAVRDWVRNGERSRHAYKREEAIRRTRMPTEAAALASAWFRLGKHFQEKGDLAAAQKYLKKAVGLRPESWNFRRQTYVLADPALTGQLNSQPEFFADVAALGDRHYYEPVDMEGMLKPG
jgi:tetratricopeptide (TPR) repeat protein